MDVSKSHRLIRSDEHDDGTNRWSIKRLAPAQNLRGHIRTYSDYWESTGGFTVRREMPGVDPVLIINLGEAIRITGGDGATIGLKSGEAFVAGAHARHALSQSSGSQAGIHVHLPLQSLGRLLGMPLEEIVDRAVPLDALAGPWARLLCSELADAPDAWARAAILDRHLASRLNDGPTFDPQIRHAVERLSASVNIGIAELASDLGWSRKHFGVRFRAATGLAPQMFRRLARFGRMVARLQSGDSPGWVPLAIDSGYFDQSHMIRDFRDFAGVTPREFIARSMPNMGGLVEG